MQKQHNDKTVGDNEGGQGGLRELSDKGTLFNYNGYTFILLFHFSPFFSLLQRV